jgi:methionyl aminopeptidase
MNDEEFDNYREAGRIAAAILKEGASHITEGAPYLELVESVQARIEEEGVMMAFPVNVSLNEDAAHDTASAEDPRIFQRGDVVKLDLGVAVDGYIADTATTVDLGTNSLLLQASEAALESAIAKVRPGATAGDLGAAVQQEIERRG